MDFNDLCRCLFLAMAAGLGMAASMPFPRCSSRSGSQEGLLSAGSLLSSRALLVLISALLAAAGLSTSVRTAPF
ncbi:hypothetical protein K4L06_06160 [Lysobacter sp. BMK333-48F3]|uniref:hypothetical protein n=1 Tax=Lysobacter sp. BMK333-48F3 TaxID=2867962 RepID=UPI001C8C923B|nr:hypothetical protein [Lysobacter sp. BMK333-48F3]MBX9400890.1 hypothetical protein [Lysobacter sp. BMK333-48F3]